MDYEEDRSATAGYFQDDSGYHTNTPLSCELVQSIMERLPRDSTDLHHSTPVGVISKLKQKSMNSPKTLDGILTQEIKYNFPLGQIKNPCDRPHICNQSPMINDYRKRLHSLPSLMSYETIQKKECYQDVPSKHIFRRLSCIDLNSNSIYQGWFNLNSKKPSLDEKVDIIAKLCAEKNLLNMALKIFGNLEPQDLLSASKVTVFWRHIIKQDKALASKLKHFKLQKKLQLLSDVGRKENTSVDAAGSVGRRSSCTDIKNLMMSRQGSGGPVALPPPSLTDVARKNGRWLRLCPKCSHPAQVEVCGILAQCLHQDCGLLFCVKCRFKMHGGEKCKAIEYESPMRIIVGSKKSRRNIRRL